MAKNDFQYGGWNSYTLQCRMWLWNRNSEFTKWQHSAMWYVTLWWLAIEFAQTSAILEFYIRFRFRPHLRSHSAPVSEILIQIRLPSAEKKMTSCWFSRCRISAIMDFRGPIIGSLKSRCGTSYRSSMDAVALNCLVFEKLAFLHFGDKTDEQKQKQMDTPVAWSRSRCRECQLNKATFSQTARRLQVP